LTADDLHTIRLPTALRGYRMQEVDDVLDRLALELSARDARIAELEAVLTGAGPPAAQAGDRGGDGSGDEDRGGVRDGTSVEEPRDG
jgi:DivIVA domain-containing protein